jgi:hypothetical protein
MNIGEAIKYCGIDRVKHSTQRIYGYEAEHIDVLRGK